MLANMVLTVIMKMSFVIVKFNHCEVEVDVHSSCHFFKCVVKVEILFTIFCVRNGSVENRSQDRSN